MILDDAIAAVQSEELAVGNLPAIDIVAYHDRFVVVNGNRRLFAPKVLASKGIIVMLRVHLRHVNVPIIQRVRWDGRLGQLATK